MSALPELRRFRDETVPSEFAVARLRRRVRLAPRRLNPLLLVGSGALAGALAACLVVLLLPAQDLDPQPLSTAAPTELKATQHVQLEYAGRGELVGDADSPRIQWESGRLTARVTPNRGIDLRVSTPEAEVRVVGTVFTVERDLLGTRVHVERGKVAVTCDGGQELLLVGGDEGECLPRSAAGLLARARALQFAAGDDVRILASLDAGLDRQASDAVRAELRWVRAEHLASMGLDEDARSAARAALRSEPLHRRADFVALARTP